MYSNRLAGILTILCAMPLAALAQQQEEEIIVIGKYLYTDQVNALKTPTPIIDVPQSLSIITADQITLQASRVSATLSTTHPA